MSEVLLLLESCGKVRDPLTIQTGNKQEEDKEI